MREQHYPSGARHMPLENDFTRVFGAIKELEARVERMERRPNVYLSKAIQVAPAIIHEGTEPWSWEYEAEQRGDELQRAVTENNQLRFILSILAAVKDDGWIEWHGGRVPPVLDDYWVDVKYRSGEVYKRRRPSNMRWSDCGNRTDIIAYRIAR